MDYRGRPVGSGLYYTLSGRRPIGLALCARFVGCPAKRAAYTGNMSTDLLEEARKLSPRERLQLIGALWDALSQEDIPVTAEERTLLDSRLADLEANPGDQSPWPEAKARLDQRRR